MKRPGGSNLLYGNSSGRRKMKLAWSLWIGFWKFRRGVTDVGSDDGHEFGVVLIRHAEQL